MSMPLSEGADVAVSVDYVGPLPLTPSGNTYILLFTDRFSHRPDMLAVTSAKRTAWGRANILIGRYIALWGCPSIVRSACRLQAS